MKSSAARSWRSDASFRNRCRRRGRSRAGHDGLSPIVATPFSDDATTALREESAQPGRPDPVLAKRQVKDSLADVHAVSHRSRFLVQIEDLVLERAARRGRRWRARAQSGALKRKGLSRQQHRQGRWGARAEGRERRTRSACGRSSSASTPGGRVRTATAYILDTRRV